MHSTQLFFMNISSCNFDKIMYLFCYNSKYFIWTSTVYYYVYYLINYYLLLVHNDIFEKFRLVLSHDTSFDPINNIQRQMIR